MGEDTAFAAVGETEERFVVFADLVVGVQFDGLALRALQFREGAQGDDQVVADAAGFDDGVGRGDFFEAAGDIFVHKRVFS